MDPLVAILGRPNAGKSTLFNRLTRSRDALVDDLPGVTRDRHYGHAVWNGVSFGVVDTGGFIEGDAFSAEIRSQIEQAAAEADLLVLLFDGRAGLSPFDRDLVDLVRRMEKPRLCVVNKIDGPRDEVRLAEFHRLGLEEIHPLSAEHRYGWNDFLDALVARLPTRDTPPPPEEERPVAVAFVGRPNVGKSSLINRILGRERMIVSPIPGTTRDAIDIDHECGGRRYRLVDTAGIRRKSAVEARLEKFSVLKALQRLERCDIALIVIDASEGVVEQDLTIAGYALERGCGCVLLANKWDLAAREKTSEKAFLDHLKERAGFLSFAPRLAVSARTGKGVGKIFPLVDRVAAQYAARIPTAKLNRLFTEAVARNAPPLHRGRPVKIYYATQAATRPPSFVVFANHPQALPSSYRRYLVNRIREETGLTATPIRLWVRERERRAAGG